MFNNQVILIGRICATPKIRSYRCKEGRMICFDVTTAQDEGSSVYSRHHVVVKDGPKDHLATRFKSLFIAGKILFISGQLHHRNFIDRDLRTIEITEVIAQSINEITPHIPVPNALSLGGDRV